MLAERRNHFADGEARSVGVREHACGEGTQPAFVLARRTGLKRRGADKRSDAAPRLDDPGPLELRVDACDSVGVDAEADGELADVRPLAAHAQAPAGARRARPAFERGVDLRR